MLKNLILNKLVKLKIESILEDGDEEELVLVGDVNAQNWLTEHLGLRETPPPHFLINVPPKIERYVTKFELSSAYYCLDINRNTILQTFPINVTWITDIDEVSRKL